jgi:tetratricopeptide (TPR) repeat protein
MKRLRRYLPLLALLLMLAGSITSCRDADVRDALQRAEALMETDPHAARAVLMEIEDGRLKIEDYPTAEGNKTDRDTTNQPPADSQRKGKKAKPQFSIFNFQSKRDAALYALLRTQADYKCRVRLTSDSLPLIATNYYGTKRKSQRAALAQHYLGCTYIEMHRDLDAIEAQLRATSLFPDTTYKYFAHSLLDLGRLYIKHYMVDSAWVALGRYRQTEVCNSDSVNIGYADYYMGTIALYHDNDELTDSLFKCVLSNTKIIDYFRFNTYFQLAKLRFYHQHDIEGALAYIEKIEDNYGEGNSALLTLKADILAQQQQPAMAYDFYKKAIRNSSDIYVQCTSYEGLASVAPFLTKPDSTRYFIDLYKGLLDSIYTMNKQREITEIKDKHIVEIHDQQMRARNMRLRLAVGIFIIVLLSAFIITLLLIDRKRKNEKLKYEDALNTIRQKQMAQLAQKEETPPDAEGYDEEPDVELDAVTPSDSPFIALQRERIALYRSQYATSPWPQYFKAHEADITLEKKMNIAQSKELMLYLDTLFADMFVVMYGSNLNLNKNDFEYCAMVVLGFSTAQMSYCTQATVHSYHCRHGKMKTILSDDWYQIIYGREKPKKKSE